MATSDTRVPVVIVGLGALGSHAALALRNVTSPLRLVDFDRIEAKNVASQHHLKVSVGKNKAQALAQLLTGFFGRQGIVAIPHRLVRDNAQALLGDARLVLDCTDNQEARNTIQDLTGVLAIPCLHACISPDGSLARIVWSEHFQADPEGEAGGATCEDGANLPFHAIVGAHVAREALTFLVTDTRRSLMLTASSVVRIA